MNDIIFNTPTWIKVKGAFSDRTLIVLASYIEERHDDYRIPYIVRHYVDGDLDIERRGEVCGKLGSITNISVDEIHPSLYGGEPLYKAKRRMFS